MQTLGISDSTPKPENRIKTLFWPAIRHETDVDLVTRQGFWVCVVLSAITLVTGFTQPLAVTILEFFESFFYFLSGVGVRMRSKIAAISVFLAYFATSFLAGIGSLRIVLLALLLANVRGTWLSSTWRASATEPPPVPLNDTFADKLADRMPIALWPKVRFVYYFLAAFEALLIVLALINTRLGH